MDMWDRFQGYSHFTDEEIETQEGQVTFQSSFREKIQDSKPIKKHLLDIHADMSLAKDGWPQCYSASGLFPKVHLWACLTPGWDSAAFIALALPLDRMKKSSKVMTQQT